jgi:hypothetical protein
MIEHISAQGKPYPREGSIVFGGQMKLKLLLVHLTP